MTYQEMAALYSASLFTVVVIAFVSIVAYDCGVKAGRVECCELLGGVVEGGVCIDPGGP